MLLEVIGRRRNIREESIDEGEGIEGQAKQFSFRKFVNSIRDASDHHT